MRHAVSRQDILNVRHYIDVENSTRMNLSMYESQGWHRAERAKRRAGNLEQAEPSCALARNFARSARSLTARDAHQYFILVSPIQVIESCSIHLRGLSVKNLILYATKSSTLTFAFLFEVTNL